MSSGQQSILYCNETLPLVWQSPVVDSGARETVVVVESDLGVSQIHNSANESLGVWFAEHLECIETRHDSFEPDESESVGFRTPPRMLSTSSQTVTPPSLVPTSTRARRTPDSDENAKKRRRKQFGDESAPQSVARRLVYAVLD